MKLKILLSILMIMFIIQEGALSGGYRPMPFMDAILKGDYNTFSKMLNEDPAHARTSSSRHYDPPLVEAARQGDVKMVRALLAAGADVSAQGGMGGMEDTALHKAVWFGYPEVVKLLTDKILEDPTSYEKNPFFIKNTAGENAFELPADTDRPADIEKSPSGLADRHGRYANQRDYNKTKLLVQAALQKYSTASESTKCTIKDILSCRAKSKWHRLGYCPYMPSGYFKETKEDHIAHQGDHKHASICSIDVDCQVQCKEGYTGTYSDTAICNPEGDYCSMSASECATAPQPVYNSRANGSEEIKSAVPGALEPRFSPNTQ